ncbi:hypothetical protein PHYBLDRAFT_160202 [Phycomyces blakesleeanus NRRL 1555(-)]|uniref:Uncharacterized protein n=1 Tax=Phycomyces blakesleeanus (strain ATCC 8743b / DSM 1359 / FGSC 10004 / NBRC 33097 / NRRL 1555) TaxID=763407 RepID=A0A162NCD4_PHYB8|nr:hypothetical protein PHYBLDRAFT_160202 [Phycomyces blakesleeanus NRRL 1555(-)]OAD68024.1 hypothetical protein PHYBLDRAFT_160202 [Phycomyces blakesleeanus NRRL 1555(-)]|eukprot:XP_018286064.1 hypothetical protein PHYBLDRAFT_160202 [Phycomyces blakesleeanus NRRL 1555(-)]
MVGQHQKELNVLQNQFQHLLDLKDKELEDFSYRLKTVTSAQQKDLEKLHQAHRLKVSALEDEGQKREEELKSKAMELRWMETDVEGYETKLKEQDNKVHALESDNDQLQLQVERLRQENEHILSLLDRLQLEMRQQV